MTSVHCPTCGALISGKSKWELKRKLENHYKNKHPRIYKRNLVKSTKRAEKVGQGIGMGLVALSHFFR